MLDFAGHHLRSTNPPWTLSLQYQMGHIFVHPVAGAYKYALDGRDIDGLSPGKKDSETIDARPPLAIPRYLHYSGSELEMLHRNIFHPLAGKMFALIRRAEPQHASPSVWAMVDRRISSCAACRTFATPPFRFRAYITPDKIVFNQELVIDLVWLEQQPFFRIVDTHNRFQGAVVLRSKRGEGIWQAFMQAWVTVCTG